MRLEIEEEKYSLASAHAHRMASVVARQKDDAYKALLGAWLGNDFDIFANAHRMGINIYPDRDELVLDGKVIGAVYKPEIVTEQKDGRFTMTAVQKYRPI